MDELYKQEHETFVSGSKGTTVAEIICLTLLTPVWSVTVATCLHALQEVSLMRNFWVHGAFEAVSISLPLISAVTFLSGYATKLLVLVIGVSAVSLFCRKYLLYSQPIRSQGTDTSFISQYRSQLLLDTSISILAVDFPIYPRRLAKTELYGFGYMDVGVGCFIFAAGLVSAEARALSVTSARWKYIKETLKSQAPMAVLGFARAISVWAVNYHVQVTEYGIHWNFFLTIVAVKLICSCLMCTLGVNVVTWLTGLCLGVYQWFLNRGGLIEFILHQRREGFFQQNKEGIISLIGYCFLYQVAVHTGRIIFRSKLKRTFLVKLFFAAVAGFLAMTVSHQLIQPVSRRLLNITYILWMVFFNCSLLVLISVCDKIITDKMSLYTAINKNAVVHFLLANLMTGVVNFMVNTIHASSSIAIFIILLYNACLSLIVLYFHKNRLKIDLLRFKINKSK